MTSWKETLLKWVRIIPFLFLILITCFILFFLLCALLNYSKPQHLLWILRSWKDPLACTSCHTLSYLDTHTRADRHRDLSCRQCHFPNAAQDVQTQPRLRSAGEWFFHATQIDNTHVKRNKAMVIGNCKACHEKDLAKDSLHSAAASRGFFSCLSCHGEMTHRTAKSERIQRSVGTRSQPRHTFSGQRCILCHTRLHPKLVREWLQSSHVVPRLECAVCHEANHRVTAEKGSWVSAERCGRCHAQATQEFLTSAHGRAADALESSVRYHVQTERLKPQDCYRCHRIGVKTPWDDQSVQCAVCHRAHAYPRGEQRDPKLCASCHDGPDADLYEMWKTSAHGRRFKTSKGQKGAVCQDCHGVGTHDVRQGLVYGLMEQGLSDSTLTELRAKYVEKTCFQCHAKQKKVIRDFFTVADSAAEEAQDMVGKARFLIEELDRDGSLQPLLKNVSPNPLTGRLVELGPFIHYDENYPKILKLYFRMRKLCLRSVYKAIFHADPRALGRYGWNEMARLYEGILSEYNQIKTTKTRTTAPKQ